MVRLALQPIDTARGVFRTWYAATDGFTMPSSDKPPRGRFDPQLQHKKMPDYIEPADSQSCFSPYTTNTRDPAAAGFHTNPADRGRKPWFLPLG
jgi:hypothetical protein